MSVIHKIITPKRFTYESHKWLRGEIATITKHDTVEVHLHHTEYLDSSALGMLLILRDLSNGSVVLKGCAGDVLKVLEIANFSKLFSIN